MLVHALKTGKARGVRGSWAKKAVVGGLSPSKALSG